MDVETLTAKVVDAVQDGSFTEEFILGAFNKCLGELASVYTLPDLIANEVVVCEAGATSTSMPVTYLKNLHFAANLTKKCRVSIIDALTTFLDRFPFQDEEAPVDTVCAQGAILYFQGVPTEAETLRLFFVRKPVLMEEDEDEPDGLPGFLHEDLLVNYACAECFNLIEEGIDGAKIQFNKYISLYQQAQIKLESFLGVPPEAPDFVPETEITSSFDV